MSDYEILPLVLMILLVLTPVITDIKSKKK